MLDPHNLLMPERRNVSRVKTNYEIKSTRRESDENRSN